MIKRIFIVAIFLFFLFLSTGSVEAQSEPVVHAVLFYSPTCPHCEFVITETLPPLMQKYGDQLQIIGINVSEQQGSTLFLAALDKFKLQKGGVPFLVIGNRYLIGSGDIPEQLPGLIETYLAQGGVDWPDVPGLREVMAEADATQQESSVQESAPTVASASSDAPAQGSVPLALELPETPANLTWQQKFAQDKAGNTLSVIVLIGMIGAITWTGMQFQQKKMDASKHNHDWLIPVLCAIGFGVAGYLAYVETTQVAAVCGPVGDCNTVQQSEYARLFGILPIGVMGLAGYVAIMIAWLTARYAEEKIAALATLSIFGMAVFGTLFSIYLTFLEPFVIGATCAWCVTSAVLMTVLMLLSAGNAKAAFAKLGYSHFVATYPGAGND
jgi:uncharacterized membrane protein/thiol-disulfide isomerase/thioredoxin